MKRKISIILIILILFSLGACKSSDKVLEENLGVRIEENTSKEAKSDDVSEISKDEQEVNELGKELFVYKTNYTGKEIELQGFNQDYIKNELDGQIPSSIGIPSEIEGQKVVSIEQKAFKGMGLKEVDFTYAKNLISISGFDENGLIELDLRGAKKVKTISGFYKNDIKSVNLENLEDLERISAMAFQENQLEEVKFKNNHSLKQISPGAFAINNLTELDLSDAINLERIDSSAFNRNYLTKIDLGASESLSEVDLSAFKQNGPKKNSAALYWVNEGPRKFILTEDFSWEADE